MMKSALGFVEGYITLFKGNTKLFTEWFAEKGIKYHKLWEWYLPSSIPLPDIIPAGLTTVRLYWDDVANKSETAIKTTVGKLLYEPSPSSYQGKIGDKIEVELLVLKAIDLPESYYGKPKFYVMTDKNGNQFTWTTAAKILVEGETYSLRGNIKEHKIYKGIPQTVLSHCTII